VPKHEFKFVDLVNLLEKAKGQTLGEADVNNVFYKTISNPKVTGIAGDVVEQSILKYPPDNKQDVDLVVDGVDTELKTTGLKRVKRGDFAFDAKEPVSVTAVSPEKIVDEEFDYSKLWHKLENILFVYYLYDSDKTVPAAEYASFPIQDYQFHKFSDDDKRILQNDWEIVRDFIRKVNSEEENPLSRYPEISKLREKMMFMDTAPKYPNLPRFRLRRSVVSTIIKEHFGKDFELLQGSNKFCSYEELYKILRDFAKNQKGKNITHIAQSLNIVLKRNLSGVVNKSVAERVLTAAFGAESGKLRDIEVFAKIGIIPKTITLSSKGFRTEDTKLDAIDFVEWADMSIKFEESSVYNYFANHSMLFSVFQEPHAKSPLEENVFLGFKRLSFDDEFIYKHVKPTWDRVRELVNNNELTVGEKLTKYGDSIVNKSGTRMEATNFPKSKDYVVFIRGSAQDSTKKTYTINGLNMYPQQFWIKGKVLVEMLSKIEFI